MPSGESQKKPRTPLGILSQILPRYTPAGIGVVWITRVGLARFSGRAVGQLQVVGPGALIMMDLDKPALSDEFSRKMGVKPEISLAYREELAAFGCLDDLGRVTCIWPHWIDLEVQLRPGIPVLYDAQEGDYFGVIDSLSPDGSVVYLFLFEPIPKGYFPVGTVEGLIRDEFWTKEGTLQIVPIDRFTAAPFRLIRMEWVRPDWGVIKARKEWLNMKPREIVEKLNEEPEEEEDF